MVANDAIDLAEELDTGLRLERSSGPADDDSTIVPAAPSLEVTTTQGTCPGSETNEALPPPPLESSQQQHGDASSTGAGEKSDDNKHYTILCDMAYGMPREARPRKEKIRAIARQLVNFLSWQHHQHQQQQQSDHDDGSSLPSQRLLPALVKIVGCPDASIEQSLKERMLELWVQEVQAAATATSTSDATTTPVVTTKLPDNLTFTHQSLESCLATSATRTETGNISGHHQQQEPRDDILYLSPDSNVALDPANQPPPTMVVVGLLIDRKHIQVDRSIKRAQALSIPAVRWPLEKIVLVQQEGAETSQSQSSTNTSVVAPATTTNNTITVHASEPLNCDCILEGMQQWYWNYETHQQNTQKSGHGNSDDDDQKKAAVAREACFSDAVLQALQHHVERHPGRPIHKSTS
jgi:hypothetical protein